VLLFEEVAGTAMTAFWERLQGCVQKLDIRLFNYLSRV
jgi:hypothetical protein